MSTDGPNLQDTIPDLSVYSAHDTVSAAFTLTNVFGGTFPDLAIASSEKTMYYVHFQQLSSISLNFFDGMLTETSFLISILEPAAALDIVLYIIYGMSCTHHNPPLRTIEAAIDALMKYGVPLSLFASPTLPLYPLLLLRAPHYPIDAYALAGKYGFEGAAVAISGYLLAYDLSRISDELSVKMGPVYLRRLINMLCTRVSALRSMVLRPLEAHPPTAACGGASQALLTQAWAFVAAQLAWDTLPISQAMFEKAGKEISCEDCRMVLRARIHEVCWQWSEVKRTIRDDSDREALERTRVH